MIAAEILSQGDEVVTGQVADTNAAWLSEQLTALGFDMVRHTAVGDRQSDIVDAMKQAFDRSALVVSTGGLGPTDDDLTAASLAQVLGVDLEFDPVAMATIEGHYARVNRRMPEVNRKQAWLPRGCLRLDNDWGTAPGFAAKTSAGWAAFLPGVPREMKQMYQHRVLPLIEREYQVRPGRLYTLRTTGIGESDLQERIGPFQHPDVVLSYRTRLPENHIKLRFPAHVPQEQAESIVRNLADRIGSPVFCVEGIDSVSGDLHEVVVGLLVTHQATLAVAESCTGGQISAAITSVPGASSVFLEGVVAYANAAKIRLLGVTEDQLQAFGAVSEPVARSMAEGIRQHTGSTYALSSTGVAGPGGGSPDKPVGTVHIALATPEGTHHRLLRLGGDRARIQTLSAAAALDLLRRHLQGLLSNHP
jgi:nicotinamide-nucleotide amidase